MNVFMVYFKNFGFIIWRGKLGIIEVFKEGCDMINFDL